MDLPVIDLAVWLDPALRGSPQAAAAAAEVAQCLHDTGILIVRDPRATMEANDAFVDMLERYFDQPDEVTAVDARPELFFQVGTTPPLQERPRNHCASMAALGPDNRPLSLCPPELDPKARFFWRLGGEGPPTSRFPRLNAPAVIPAGFPEWAATMDTWGATLLDAVTTVASMAAVGLGLPEDALTSRMVGAPHLLAPTASRLGGEYGALNTVLAGVHQDLNLLTIHGKSRYPGLYVWTRAGERRAVRLPVGCLLVQAGKQLTYATGGDIAAGFHEVVVDEGTVEAMARAAAAGRPLVRISSTAFAHFASDVVLEPLGRFAELPGAAAAYPPMLTGDHVAAELAAINLAGSS